MKVSFMHAWDSRSASYRYRALIPATELGATMNDPSADILIFAKPCEQDVAIAWEARDAGKMVIVDFCDDHFEESHYLQMAKLADHITCPTDNMAMRIAEVCGRFADVIPDPYEFGELNPHCAGDKLLWFGHGSNLPGFLAMIRTFDDYPLMIVSNHPMAMPWSHEEMLLQFAAADIVILPATAPYKSANRAVESIRQGCFVVAQPHPSLEGFPGIWIGDLKEGIEWAKHNPQEARQRTKIAQEWIASRFSPATQASAWRSLFERAKSRSTSGVASATGPAGSTSMDRMSVPT